MGLLAILAFMLTLWGCGPKAIKPDSVLDTPENHFSQGMTQFERGNLDEAMREFERANALNPDYAEAYSGMALVYATSPRGACHNQGDMYWVEMGRGVPELGIEPADRFEMAGRAQSVAHSQDYRSFYNALIMCIFSNPPPQDVADMLASATGWDVGLEEVLAIGERIWNLKRALNNRLGLNRSNDRLPKALLKPLPDGGAAGHQLDLDLMLREFYAVRGWDWATGRPNREKLVSLGLNDIAADLWL